MSYVFFANPDRQVILAAEANFNNIIHLALIIGARLEKDRPDCALVATSNPGTEEERFISLTQRLYKTKTVVDDDGNAHKAIDEFLGYVCYRFNEVRYKSKKEKFPVFSSIEIRNENFISLQKIHFTRKKVEWEDPAALAQCDLEAVQKGWNETQTFNALGAARLETAYQAILEFIHHHHNHQEGENDNEAI